MASSPSWASRSTTICSRISRENFSQVLGVRTLSDRVFVVFRLIDDDLLGRETTVTKRTLRRVAVAQWCRGVVTASLTRERAVEQFGSAPGVGGRSAADCRHRTTRRGENTVRPGVEVVRPGAGRTQLWGVVEEPRGSLVVEDPGEQVGASRASGGSRSPSAPRLRSLSGLLPSRRRTNSQSKRGSSRLQ